MKIGIDLDGVVIDSETTFRTYEEIFSIENLGGRKMINSEEPKFQQRYDWSKEEQQMFVDKYFMEISRNSNLMSGFKTVFDKLKGQGHEFVVITARGGFIPKMKDDAIRILEENGIQFDKYYWKIDDKLEICQKENVDVMIDDDHRIVKKLNDNNVKALYFRDTNLVKLEESNLMHEVNNWGDVYRYICENEVKRG